MSRRWRRCARSSRSRIECEPRIGRRISLASPACATSGAAVKSSRIASGSASMTQGRGSMWTVKASPKRARCSEANGTGRASHRATCAIRGSDGPGGRPPSMNACVHFAAMPAPATATPAEIRDVNTRYHDGAAAGYDAKWGIDYGAVGRAQVLAKVRKALGGDAVPTFERGLEIGAGTGYFALNLLQAGVLREAVCTDISPGM